MRCADSKRRCSLALPLALAAIVATSELAAQNAPVFPGPQYGLSSVSPVAVDPMANALGDLNGDGSLDHAAAMRTGYVALSFGDGLGGFASPRYVACGVEARDIALGDWDGDGELDIASLIRDPSSGLVDVAVLLNIGSGQFGSPVSVPLGSDGGRLEVLDADGDGALDLAVALPGGLAFLFGDSAGAFSLSGATFPVTLPYVFGDFTGDQAPDVLQLVYTTPQTLELHVNDGAGSLIHLGVVATLPASPPAVFSPLLAAGDFDADGDLDVAVSQSQTVVVVLGDGAGSFSSATSYVVGTVTYGFPWPLAADVNGDGYDDVVTRGISDTAGEVIVVIHADGGGGFGVATEHYGSQNMLDLAVGDLNGDARPDVAAVSFNADAIAVALSDGPSGILPTAKSSLGAHPAAIELIDLDGDGHLDVLTRDATGFPFGSGPSSFSVALGDGQASFGAIAHYTSTDLILAAVPADWDGDLDIDVLSASATAGSHFFELWLGDGLGGLSGSPAFGSAAAGVNGARAADVDGNGRVDLVVAHAASSSIGAVSWLKSTGAGHFASEAMLIPCYSGCATDVRLGDLDLDGKLDLAFARADGHYEAHLGDGAGGFAFAADLLFGAKDIKIADLSGDSRPDLVLLASGAAEGVAVALGAGDGSFGAPATYAAPFLLGAGSILQGFEAMGVADIDGDGSLDVVTRTTTGGTIFAYLGDGAGGLVPDRGYSGPLDGRIALGDLDEDGQVDLVACNTAGKTLVVLPNRKPCAGSIQSYGLGCPGAGGFVPVLSLTGCAEAGETVSLHLDHGLGGSVGFVLYGAVKAEIPFPGGCHYLVGSLLPVVTVLPLSAGAPGTGSKSVSTALLPVGSGGASLAMQAVVFDPAAAGSFASTNGVWIHIP